MVLGLMLPRLLVLGLQEPIVTPTAPEDMPPETVTTPRTEDGQRIKEPRKTKHVPPQWPENALRLSQVEPEVRDAILGNVGTLIAFRVGVQDAELLAKELYPAFAVDDLIRLPNYQIYVRLMVGGVPAAPFSAEALRLPD